MAFIDIISKLHADAGVSSPTGAMKDAFKAREKDLEGGLRTFVHLPGQTGLLAVIGGKVAGFDIIPYPEVYRRLHPKLVKSYVIDALAAPASPTDGFEQDAASATNFLRDVTDSVERVFPSIGYGQDCRYQKAGVAGTALVHDGKVVHLSFLSVPMGESHDPRMAST